MTLITRIHLNIGRVFGKKWSYSTEKRQGKVTTHHFQKPYTSTKHAHNHTKMCTNMTTLLGNNIDAHCESVGSPRFDWENWTYNNVKVTIKFYKAMLKRTALAEYTSTNQQCRLWCICLSGKIGFIAARTITKPNLWFALCRTRGVEMNFTQVNIK